MSHLYSAVRAPSQLGQPNKVVEAHISPPYHHPPIKHIPGVPLDHHVVDWRQAKSNSGLSYSYSAARVHSQLEQPNKVVEANIGPPYFHSPIKHTSRVPLEPSTLDWRQDKTNQGYVQASLGNRPSRPSLPFPASDCPYN